jgi:argininosuccinate lyase
MTLVEPHISPVAPEMLDLVYRRWLADFAGGFDHMVRVNRAHAVMLGETGILSTTDAGVLLRALDRLEADGAEAMTPDPALEDAYLNFEAEVIAIAGPSIGGRLHIGRSRNDLYATLNRLQCRDAALDIIDAVNALRRDLIEQAAIYADAVMPGYTHLQPAQPSTWGYYLLGLAEAFARDAERIAATWARINRNPLGAAAMTGTRFPIDCALTTRLLGFDAPFSHAQDAVASRDYAIELLAACTQATLTCSRLAEDMQIMVSHECHTLDLPARLTGTSSIMPQKRNPLIMEHLKGVSAQILGAFVAGVGATKATIYSNTIDGCRESLTLAWPAFKDTADCLRLTSLLVKGATPNAKRMLELAAANFSTATELADLIVERTDLSFRQAHHLVGAVVRTAITEGLRADEITVEMIDAAAENAIGHPLRLDPHEIRRALDPSAVVASRKTTGGPAPDAVRAHARSLGVDLDRDQAVQDRRRAQLTEADALLRRMAGDYAAAR